MGVKRHLFVIHSRASDLTRTVAEAIEHTLPASSADLRAQALEHFDRARELEEDAARQRRLGEALMVRADAVLVKELEGSLKR